MRHSLARHQGSVRAELGPSSRRRFNLLKKQKPLVKKYWATAGQEITMFKNGDAVIGASWRTDEARDRVPRRRSKTSCRRRGNGAGSIPGWSRRRRRTSTALTNGWRGFSTPKVQAQQAELLRETPGEQQGVRDHGQAVQGLVRAVPRERAASSTSSRFTSGRRRSQTDGNGQKNCMDYTKWQQAWTNLKG